MPEQTVLPHSSFSSRTMPAGGNLTYIAGFWQRQKDGDIKFNVDVNIWDQYDYQKLGLAVVNNHLYVLWALRMDNEGRVWVDAGYTPTFLKNQDQDMILGVSVDNNFLVRYRPKTQDGIIEIAATAPEQKQAFAMDMRYTASPFEIDGLAITYYYKHFFAMAERDLRTNQSRYAIGVQLYGVGEPQSDFNPQVMLAPNTLGVIFTTPEDY